MATGPDVDRLILGTLRSPILTELMTSQQMKAEMGAVANEVKRRYLAIYQAKARRTGNLGSTAKVTYHRSTAIRDRRWETEFSVGGPKAPYVIEVEAQDHILSEALRQMGYPVGDIVHGPTNVPRRAEDRVTLYHRTSSSAAESIVNEGYQPAYDPAKHGAAFPRERTTAFFTENPSIQPHHGPSVVAVDVPRSMVQESHGEGTYEVEISALNNLQFRHFNTGDQ